MSECWWSVPSDDGGNLVWQWEIVEARKRRSQDLRMLRTAVVASLVWGHMFPRQAFPLRSSGRHDLDGNGVRSRNVPDDELKLFQMLLRLRLTWFCGSVART